MASQKISRLNNAGIIGFGGGSSSNSSSSSSNNNNNNNSVNNSNSNKIKLLILGAANVGKTAFVVRLITKRFIGEYDQNKETLYTHRLQPTPERDDVILLEILDSANCIDDAQLEANIRWADGFIFIYSVSDRKSFEFVERHLALVLRLRANSSSGSAVERRRRGEPTTNDGATSSTSPHVLPPIVIAANKTDCPTDARRVTTDDGQRLVETVTEGRGPPESIAVRELSVAESPLGVAALVEDVVRQALVVRRQHPHHLLQQHKGSSRSPTPAVPTLGSSSSAAMQSSPLLSGSGSPGADRMSATLTNVRRVLRDKIYNRSRSDTLMTTGVAGNTGGGGLMFGK